MPVLKNARHELFAQEVAKGSSASDAYAAAGYKDGRNANRFMKNEEIIARIADLQNRGAERAVASVARIVEEIERLSFSDISEAIEIRKNKIYLKDLKKLPKAVTAAISSLKQTKEGIEVKFYNKTIALDMLARHKGMYRENINLTVAVSLVDLVLGSYPQPEAPKQIEGKVVDKEDLAQK